MAQSQHRSNVVPCAFLCVFALATACSSADLGDASTSSPAVSTLPSSTTLTAVPGSATNSTAATSTQPEPSVSGTQPEPEPSVSGAQSLASSDFELLKGKRVGLIANQTSSTADGHLADLMSQHSGLELVALFAPEHGLRGDILAGDTVGDATDPATKLPIFSLYGATRKPSVEMLDGLDVLVFDIQDVGARFYTFISTMGLAMQAAAEADIDFVVLDRPNPLGGVGVAGFTTTPGLQSFISQYPVPSVYGLTSGELALAIQGEGWLPGLNSLNLTVVPISGWSRDMLWPAWSPTWTPPSPALPTFDSALAYPGVVLFEATNLDYGRGTDLPFLRIVGDGFDGVALAQDLNGRQLPGVRFQPETGGVSYEITDAAVFEPVSAGVHVLEAFYNSASSPIIDRPDVFDRLAGSTRLRTMLEAGASAQEVVDAWQADVATFEPVRQKYLIY